MRIFRRLIYFLVLALYIVPVLAQSADCPTEVQAAIKAVGDLCATTGLNQACYGNVSLTAEPQPGVTSFVFDKPGDVARVANMQSLKLDAFDEVKKEWGVALMRLQANIPDTLPGQSVSFLVFGDVQLENKVDSAPSPLITLTANTVLLGAPQTDAPIVGALTAGDQAYALSQSADGAWMRVELDGSDSRTGWIPAALQPEAGELPVYDADAPSPMQAFSLKTGVTGVKCAGAPQDGILVQTPGGGDLKIKLTVNDVHVELGSTAFIQAQPSNEMRFSVLEGLGKVESKRQTVEVPAGSWVSIPMDDNLDPIGTMSPAKGYDEDELDNLPIGLLGRPITVAQPIPLVPPRALCVTNPNGAWLRAQPDPANTTIIRVLANGDRVTDAGSTANDGSQDWTRVKTSDATARGWVEAASLSDCGGTPAPVIANCTPRADWTIIYSVQPGNSLSAIAVASGTTLNELAQANCIADVNRLFTGQQLRVPRAPILPTVTPPTQPIVPVDSKPLLPQISSGRWLLTVSTQYPACDTQPPQVSSGVAAVTVSADQQTLTFVLTGVGYTQSAETFTLQRSGGNTFSGSWLNGAGAASLTVTQSNQGALVITAPCPTSS